VKRLLVGCVAAVGVMGGGGCGAGGRVDLYARALVATLEVAATATLSEWSLEELRDQEEVMEVAVPLIHEAAEAGDRYLIEIRATIRRKEMEP